MFTRIVHVFIPRERRERVAEILQSDAIFRAFAVTIGKREKKGQFKTLSTSAKFYLSVCVRWLLCFASFASSNVFCTEKFQGKSGSASATCTSDKFFSSRTIWSKNRSTDNQSRKSIDRTFESFMNVSLVSEEKDIIILLFRGKSLLTLVVSLMRGREE